MANDIVWFDSSETGAPTLNNAVGSLDAVLNACLVTGFRSITLDSVTVTGEVATATYSAGHSYSTNRMVDLAGAATSAINGRKRISVTGANTFTFPAPGVANGTISGTITAKRSPLGWTRPFSSGNVSIYQRSDPTATGMLLRVDDSSTTVTTSTLAARVVMVESAVSVGSYTAPAPTAAQNALGVYWYRGANTAAAKAWVLVGDSKRFYLFTEGGNSPFSTYAGLFPHGFGDLVPHRSGDAYHAFLAGSEGGDSVSYAFRSFGTGSTPATNGGFYIARPATQLGSAVNAAVLGLGSGSSVFGSGGPLYPSYVDNGFAASGVVFVCENNAAFLHPVRGEMPGLAYSLASGVGRALHTTVLSSVVGTTREQLVVSLANPAAASSPGALLLDTTGPWG